MSTPGNTSSTLHLFLRHCSLVARFSHHHDRPQRSALWVRVVAASGHSPTCCTFSCTRRDHTEWAEQRARKHRLKERPEYPPSRKRNFSEILLSSIPDDSPPLLGLPLELRLVIYKLVVGDHRFELTNVPKNVILKERLSMEMVNVRGGFTFKHVVDRTKRLHHLSLPLTCRQIYHEVIDLLYGCNTFTFEDPHVLVDFAMVSMPSRALD